METFRLRIQHGNGKHYEVYTVVRPIQGDWITLDGHRAMVTEVEYNLFANSRERVPKVMEVITK